MMSTRLKRPSLWKKLAIMAGLLAFQGYLGFNAVSGQYGLEANRQMLADIDLLRAREVSLQAEIEDYRHRISLFDPTRLDPDILTERARALLALVDPRDKIIFVDSGE